MYVRDLVCKHFFKVKEPATAAKGKEKMINTQGRSQHHYEGQTINFLMLIILQSNQEKSNPQDNITELSI